MLTSPSSAASGPAWVLGTSKGHLRGKHRTYMVKGSKEEWMSKEAVMGGDMVSIISRLRDLIKSG